MAKNRHQDQGEFEDFPQPEHTEHRKQPEPLPASPPPAMTLLPLGGVPAGMTPEQYAEVMAQQQRVLAITMARQAKQLEQEARSEDEHEQCKKRCALKNSEYTQQVADLRWGGEDCDRYRVSIPKDRGHPALTIPARSPEEAEGRYKSLCGIRNCEHDFSVQLISGEPVGV